MTRSITLADGSVTLVSDEDYENLSDKKWCRFGLYPGRYQSGRHIAMHRLIINAPDDIKVDHIDGDPLNNQRHNLRFATPLQNMMNRRGKRNGSSKRKGVWFDEQAGNKKWRAAIRIDGKLKYLGRFHTEDEAGDAYAASAIEHFGEFACVKGGN